MVVIKNEAFSIVMLITLSSLFISNTIVSWFYNVLAIIENVLVVILIKLIAN